MEIVFKWKKPCIIEQKEQKGEKNCVYLVQIQLIMLISWGGKNSMS
jgi:hypothetical protein